MALNHIGLFVSVTEGGRLTDLQPFNPSRQLPFGKLIKGILSSVLTPFKRENASQVAAQMVRIVREVTENK